MRRQFYLYLFLIVSTILLTPSVSSAQLQATAGDGIYRNNIYWLDFSNVSLAAGQTLTRNFDINGITVSVVIDQLVFSGAAGGGGTLPNTRLISYVPGTWFEDRLDDLYRIPPAGNPAGNTMQIALVTNFNGGAGGLRANWRIRAYASVDGQPADIGLVFANGEADASNEYTQGITNGTTWKLLEKGAYTATKTRSITFSNADNTARLQCNDNVALLYTQKQATSLASPLTIDAEMLCGGKTAIALGIIAYTDVGDAPATYGDGAHTIFPTITGGDNPSPGTNNTVYILSPPAGSQLINAGVKTNPVSPRMGALAADDDPANFVLGAGANADDNNNTDDEDGVASIPPLVSNSGSYTLNVSAFKNTSPASTPGRIYAWIDFNRNGVFESGEAATASFTANNSTQTVPLTWTYANSAISGGQSYMRLRVTTVTLNDRPSTPDVDERSIAVTIGGETEDHVIQLQKAIDLAIAKSASTPVVAGTSMTYTITLTNNGPSALVASDILTVTDNFPAAFTPVSFTASVGTYTAANSQWTGLTLATGQSATLTVTGNVAATASGSITNTVTITPPSQIVDNNTANNSASVNSTITRRIDYALAKTATPKPATAGQPFTYTITLTNNGPSAMIAGDVVTLTDNLPAGFTANAFTSSAGTYNSATGAWSGLLLASGQSATLTIAGNIAANYTGTTIVNTVTATPPAGVTDPTPNAATDNTNVQRIADLQVSKNASPATATAGEALTYTITLTNAGPSTIVSADVLTVTDNLPAGFTANTFTPGAGTYTSANGQWTGLTLAAGQSVTLTIAGTVSANVTASLINTVTATPPSGVTDPITPNTATTTTPVERKADLALTKTATPKPGVTGNSFTYTITLTNNGPSTILPADVTTLTDNLPAGFTPVAFTPSAGTYTSANGQWTGLTLASGQTATLTVTGSIDANFTGTGLTNTVTATPPTGVTDPTPPTATDNTPVTRQMDLALAKTASPKPVVAGQGLTYTITLTNNGPATLQPADVVTLSDNFPTGFTPSTFTPGAGTYSSANGQWTGLTLTTGQSATLTVAGTVSAGAPGSLTNTVTATPPPGVTDPTPPTATDVTTVNRVADLGITKTDNATTYTPGTAVVYTIVVTNTGPSDVTGATVTDALPSGITSASWTAAPDGGATVPANSGTGAISQTVSIPVGGSITYMLTLNVPAGFTGSLANTATVAAPAGVTDPTPGNNTATDTDAANPQYDLKGVKTAPASVSAGTAIQYTITFTNNGPSNLVNAAIADNIPAAITGVTWTATGQGTATVGTASGSGNAISLNGSIPAGSGNSIVVTVNGTVQASATGELQNTAQITPPGRPPVNTNTTTTTILNTTGINIVKTGPASGVVSAGNTITYTIVVTNAGPSDATNVVVLDAVPGEVTGVNWTATAGGNATIAGTASGTGNNILVTGNIPAGSGNRISITITGTIPASTTASTITNTASARPGGGTPVTSSVSTNITNDPGLAIVKSGPSTIDAGGNITYTVTVTNNGPSNAANVTISDAIPSEILNPSWTSAAAGSAAILSGGAGTGSNVNVMGNIPAGAGNSIVITITGKVDPAVTGTIENIASVSVPGKTPSPSNEISTTVNRTAALQLVKSGPAAISAGAELTYTLVLTNSGPSDMFGAVISDVVPAQLSNITVTALGAGNARVLTSNVSGQAVTVTGDVAAGSGNQITVTITGKVNPAFSGNFTNTASVTAPGQPAENSNPVTTTVTSNPVLRATKSAPASLSAGSSITYDIVITNTGLSDAIDISIADNLPAAVRNATWTATATGTGASVSAASGSGNIALTGTIPAGTGRSINITVNAIIDPAFSGTITNTVTASKTGVTPATADAATVVKLQPGLQISKSGPSAISAGNQLTYTILVSNTGPSDAINAAITDVLPTQLQSATWTAVAAGTGTTVSVPNGTGDVNLTGTIPAGAGHTITITVTGKVDPAFSGTMTNTATVTPPGGTPEVTPPVTTNVTNDPVIRILKSGPDAVNAGMPVTYVIDVTNSGASNATGVSITDNMPAQLLNATWTAVANGTGTSVSATSGNGNISITGNIPAGAGNSIRITVQGTADPAFAGTMTNTATATAPGKTPATSTKETAVSNTPNLVINKMAPSAIAAGQDITWTLTVDNTGPSNATGVAIADQIPAGLQNVTWTATATGTGTTVSAPSGAGNVNITADIPAGSGHRVTIVIKGTVNAGYTGASVQNTATATAPGKTPVTATATTEVTKESDLQIVKSGPQNAIAGQKITYVVTVTNAGPSNVVGAAINDVVPADLQNVTWTAAATGAGVTVSATSGTGNNIALTSDLPAGSGNRVTLTITGTLSPAFTGISLINTATATPPAGVTDPTPATSTVETDITREADLVIVKAGPANRAAGQAITYKLVITNVGPSDVTGAIIEDQIPAAITGLSFTLSTTGSAQTTASSLTGNTLNITGNIAAGTGNSIEVTINGVIAPATPAGDFTNTATVSPPPEIAEGNAGDNSSSITTTVTTDVGIHISKSGPAVARLGDQIIYTIEVTNSGVSDANGVIIADNVPPEVTNVSWTMSTQGNAAIVGATSGTGNNILKTVNVGASLSGTVFLTITGTISPAAGSTVVNTVTATFGGVKTSTFTTAINNTADLRMLKSAPANISAGQQITYTLDITNTGPAGVINAVIADNVPAEIQGVAWTAALSGGATMPALSGSGNNINSTANIPVDGRILITVTGIVAPSYSGVLTNTATVAPPTGVLDPTPATSTVQTNVENKPGLQITKSGPATLAAGQPVSYTVVVTNSGPSNAAGINITDAVPTQISNVTWTASAGGAGATVTAGGTGTGNSVSVTGNINAGAGNEIRIVITGTTDPAFSGTLTNTAAVTPPGGTPVTSPPVTTTVTNQVALNVVKSAPTTIAAGRNITYTLTVANGGPSTASDLSITDAVPVAITNVQWTATAAGAGTLISSGATGTGNTVTINGTLPAGSANSIQVTISGTVSPDYTGSLVNTATATAPGATPASSTATTTVSRVTGLQVMKSGPTAINSGEEIVYTIDVTNLGPSDADNTAITDNIPAEIRNVTWTATASGAGAAIVSGATGSGNSLALSADIPATTGRIMIVVRGTVDPAYTGNITNSATATLPGETPVTSGNVVTAVTAETDLQIIKSAPSKAAAGEQMTYVIEVDNAGPSNAIGAVITDNVPAALENVTWTAKAEGSAAITAGGAGTGNTLSVTGSIPAGNGHRILITITGTINSNFSGTLTNTAVITVPGQPPVTSDPTTTDVERRYDINVLKDGPSVAAAGSAITYHIDVTNAGPANASGITINDVVPAGVTVTSWTITTISGTASIPGPGSGTGNNISIPLSMDKGSHVRVTINGTVQQNAASPLTNTASVAIPPDAVDPTPDNSSTVTTNITQEPDVQLVKRGPALMRAGTVVTYEIEATNLGPSNATGIRITDPVPLQLQDVTWTATAAGGASVTTGVNGTGNNVTVTGNIPATTGAVIRIIITGRIAPDFGGTFTNVATVVVPGTTTVTEITPPVETRVVKEADLRITKTGPAEIIQGKTITYLLQVQNMGPATVSGATIQDVVPTGITAVTATVTAQGGGTGNSTVTVAGNTVNGTIGVMPAGGTATIEIKGMVSGLAELRNTAGITPPTGVTDPVPANNTSTTVVTEVIPVSKLDIAKTVTPAAPYGTGQQVTYTLRVRNDGPGALSPVAVKDVLTGAASSEATPGTPSKGTATFDVAARTLNWNIGLMNAGETVTLTYTLMLQAAGSLRNEAIVSGPPEVSIPDTAAVTIPVLKYANVEIAKTGPASIIQSQTITYVITVRNNGSADANGATIQDALPAGISNPAARITAQTGGTAGSAVNVTGLNVAATIGTFPAGGAVTLEITGTVTGTANLSNTASITPPAGVTDTVPGNNTTPPVQTIVQPPAKLDIVKMVQPATGDYFPGQQLTYTLRVTNNGPVTATGVSVADQLPVKLSAPVIATPGTGNATYNAPARTIAWSIGSLSNGQSVTLSYQATISDTGIVRNVAIVKGDAGVTVPDTATNDLRSGKLANLVVTKNLVTAPPYSVGQRVDYSIAVANRGPNDASGVRVTDVLSASLGTPTNITATRGAAIYDPGTRTITWNVGALANGEELKLTFHIQIVAGGELINSASVSGAEPDPDLSNNISAVTSQVSGDIFIPTVITPNGDGKNDRFVIPGLNKYPGSGIYIYNRWGNMVYQHKDYDNRWNGEGLNEGTYYYILKLNTAQGERVMKGWVELLR